ncbi:LEM-3-like GIY-YIG domain-containing protein [uncultured Frigoribacterium sp.]|uniref:LEM-3-like GIY-YIG domain-containing protein n=1 Tax=uncultured Frigoribacterium sp. TaxID=335377 RepID=UPI0028D6DAA3|nr:hypothetical protein [uncultured Frigoribacterium sp.]
MTDKGIPFEVAQRLAFYVYALRDPRNKEVFYVGKGQGDRILAHLQEADDSKDTQTAKRGRISEIRSAGMEVEHLFLRTGIATGADAYVVEQAVIDSFAAAGFPLTNLTKGHHAHEFGLSTVEAAIALHVSKPTPPITDPVLFFKVNRFWKPDSSPDDIYEMTHGHWHVGPESRGRAKYALGVAFGVVRAAYKIESWYPCMIEGEEKRWGFIGTVADELEHVVGTNIRAVQIDGSQNPYRKFLDGFPGAAAFRTQAHM